MKLSRFIVAASFLCALPSVLSAQIDDVRLWTGISVSHKFTRQISASFEQQLRFRTDVSIIDQTFSDLGVSYEPVRNLKVLVAYRWMHKNLVNRYSDRHRIYADLSYKYKFHRFSFTLRERISQQYADVNSSENGNIADWMLRTKFSAKFDTGRRYAPYAAAETYYLLDAKKPPEHYITRIRYSLGAEYEFNRIHSIDLFCILQHDRPMDFNSMIYGVTYNFNF
ncbi:MAG: DUF2490 domain-containing protein [Bacteroidia bacterium]